MENIDIQYRNLVKDIIENGNLKKNRTGMKSLSVFGRTVRLNLREGFPILTLKETSFKNILSELLWFLRGETNIKFLLDLGCNIWVGDAFKRYSSSEGDNKLTRSEFIKKIKEDRNFMEKWGEMGPIYGKQWRRWDGYVSYGNINQYGSVWHDQLAVAAFQLITNPDSRRIMVNSWNVDDIDKMILPPCHYSFQFYTREMSNEEKKSSNGATRAISLIWNQRSVDVPLGLPYNISSYATLLTIIGKYCNMVPEEIIGNLGDCHIYLNQIEGIKKIFERDSFPLPELEIKNSGKMKENMEFLRFDDFIEGLNHKNVILKNYRSNPKITIPLSN